MCILEKEKGGLFLTAHAAFVLVLVLVLVYHRFDQSSLHRLSYYRTLFLSIDDGAIAMPVRNRTLIALELKHSNQVKPRVKPSHEDALT